MRLLVLMMVVGSADANAYVRSRTKHGTAVYWPGACVFVQPDSAGTPDLSPDVVFATVQKSMQNWQSVTASCAYIQLKYDQPAPLEAHLDGKNIVKFRTDKWCHPDDDQNHGQCYSQQAAAITTVFYLDRPGDAQDGFIIDADIELNDINFTFVTVVEGQPLPTGRAGTSIADLENTLTHELGHLQGLDHTCKDSATPDNEVDENGNPPPDCSMLGSLPPSELAKIENATMFNSAMAGETKKRTPEADDIAGICAIYPIADAAKHSTCAHTKLSDYQTTGCQFVPGHEAAGFAGQAGGGALFLSLLGLVTLRSRRRRSR
jgi:hypothetical protein